MWHGTRGAIWTTLFALVGASMAALAMLGGPVTGESDYLISWGAGMRVEVSPLRWLLSVAPLITMFASIVAGAICYVPFLGQKSTKENVGGCCNVCRSRQRIASAIFLAGFLTALVGVFVSPALHASFHPGARWRAPK